MMDNRCLVHLKSMTKLTIVGQTKQTCPQLDVMPVLQLLNIEISRNLNHGISNKGLGSNKNLNNLIIYLSTVLFLNLMIFI